MLKIRRLRDRLIFNVGIPILIRHLYIETTPRSPSQYKDHLSRYRNGRETDLQNHVVLDKQSLKFTKIIKIIIIIIIIIIRLIIILIILIFYTEDIWANENIRLENKTDQNMQVGSNGCGQLYVFALTYIYIYIYICTHTWILANYETPSQYIECSLSKIAK